MENISINIDDREISVARGSTILEAALANNIYIPHLCHHPDLKPAGSCRVCLVEMDDGRLVTSCRTPAKDGMVIKTNSPGVDRVRRPIIEMIVSGHHTDCRDCLKKGRCGLQKIMAFMKIDKKRIEQNLRLPKSGLLRDDSNPFFIRDHNKCVLCGICVRTCQEIQEINAIDFAGRGNATRIATFGDKPIAQSICESCGECVVRCPVGALAVRNPGRPAQEVRTICPYCSVGCGVFLGTREGMIVSVRGDNENPVNKGLLCVKGRFGLGFVHSPDRLTAPLVRQGKGREKNNPPLPPFSKGGQGGFVEASWEEALNLISKNLKKYKGEEIAVIASTRCTNEENYIAQKFARVALGSNNIDTVARLAEAPSVAALKEIKGITQVISLRGKDGGGKAADIGKAACILVAGADITNSHPVLGLKIKKAVGRGARLIVINPKETGLSRFAELCMNPYPGTEAALIGGICSAILDGEMHDGPFIVKHAENFEDFRECIEEFSPGRVERITGVPRDMFEQAAKIFAEAKPATIIWDTGVTQYSHGTNNVLSLLNLAILTGNMRHPENLLPLWGRNNSLGSCAMGCLPDFYTGYQPVKDPKTRKRFETAWGKTLHPEPGLTLTEILDATRDGRIKALYIIGTDLVTGMAPAGKVREALKKAKFVVVQDMFLNETANFAHVVLPAASFAEKNGTFTNANRRVQKINQALEPAGNSMPDWQILCDLAKKLGCRGFDFASAGEIMSEISSVTSGLPAHKGRFRFVPVRYEPPAEVSDIDYPLVLTTERNVFAGGILSGKVEGLRTMGEKDLVYINPRDAADFEVEDGAGVRITSRHGEIAAVGKLTGSVPSGMISLCQGEEEMCKLIDPALDPVAKTPEMKICAVRIALKKGPENE